MFEGQNLLNKIIHDLSTSDICWEDENSLLLLKVIMISSLERKEESAELAAKDDRTMY